MPAKQRVGNSQQLDLGNKGDLPILSSGQEGRGAGGEVKVTSQGREETSVLLIGCASPGKRLRGMYFPMLGLTAWSPYLSSFSLLCFRPLKSKASPQTYSYFTSPSHQCSSHELCCSLLPPLQCQIGQNQALLHSSFSFSFLKV